MVQRLTGLLFVLLGVSILSVILVRLIPGDVVDILFQTDVGGSYVNIDRMRAFFGLDQPIYLQYLNWIMDVLRGDLGMSFRSGHSVASEIARHLPVTVELTMLGMLVAVLFGIPIGVVAAVRRNTWLDLVLRPISMLGLSMPSFWLGTLLLLLLSRYLSSVSFLDFATFTEAPLRSLKVMLLPSLALGFVSGAGIMRMTRASVLEVLNQDYIRTARAKGLSGLTVVYRHTLRSALIPVVTLIGVEFGTLIGGSVVLEEVFALPGMGRLVIIAIKQRDYPIIQGVTLLIAVGFSLVNLVIDLGYAMIDPRIRYQ